MIRFIHLFLIILLVNCSHDDSVQPDDSAQPIEDKTYFTGTVNNENWESDGVTYLNEDSTLHIRGFFGTRGYHHQIDIVLKNDNPGTYQLDSSVVSASVSWIIGMDAIGVHYDPFESSYIRVEYTGGSDHVSGDMKFYGFSQSYNDSITIISEFNLEIGMSGSEWTCDFTENGISNCRFLE